MNLFLFIKSNIQNGLCTIENPSALDILKHLSGELSIVSKLFLTGRSFIAMEKTP